MIRINNTTIGFFFFLFFFFFIFFFEDCFQMILIGSTSVPDSSLLCLKISFQSQKWNGLNNGYSLQYRPSCIQFYWISKHRTKTFYRMITCKVMPAILKTQALITLLQSDMPRLSPLISENFLLIWYGSIEVFDWAGGQYGLQYKFFLTGGVVYFEGLNVPWNKVSMLTHTYPVVGVCFDPFQ